MDCKFTGQHPGDYALGINEYFHYLQLAKRQLEFALQAFPHREQDEPLLLSDEEMREELQQLDDQIARLNVFLQRRFDFLATFRKPPPSK